MRCAQPCSSRASSRSAWPCAATEAASRPGRSTRPTHSSAPSRLPLRRPSPAVRRRAPPPLPPRPAARPHPPPRPSAGGGAAARGSSAAPLGRAPGGAMRLRVWSSRVELMNDVGNDVGERSSAAAASQSLGPPSQAAIADPAAGASDCPRWRSGLTPPPPQPAPVKNCHRRRLPARSTAQAQLALLPTPLPQPAPPKPHDRHAVGADELDH